MYTQSLYKILENHIKPKVLKRNNKYKKWEYGYNIEHDVVVGDFCHVSTSSTVNGNVEIGNNSFIGSGSILKNSIKIKNNTILQMGSIVKKNI